MRQVKYIVQTTVLLFFFVAAVTVLLQVYGLYIRGYRQLGSMIEHPSVVSREQDGEK